MDMEYLHKYTRNPFRIARSAWRAVKNLDATPDVLVLEEVFNNSRLTRKYAGWERVAERLIPEDLTTEQLRQLPRLVDLDLDELAARHAPGTVGYALASHMIANELNPNLFEPAEVSTRRDYVIAHVTETHDVWHAVTGYGTDVSGEVALLSFYAAQIGAPIFAMLLGIVMLNTAFFSHEEIGARLGAISDGWRAGNKSKSLYGLDWNTQFDRPLSEFRNEFSLPKRSRVGEGITMRAVA
jgi:ubiquinone biosynthesis protein COQ4